MACERQAALAQGVDRRGGAQVAPASDPTNLPPSPGIEGALKCDTSTIQGSGLGCLTLGFICRTPESSTFPVVRD